MKKIKKSQRNHKKNQKFTNEIRKNHKIITKIFKKITENRKGKRLVIWAVGVLIWVLIGYAKEESATVWFH